MCRTLEQITENAKQNSVLYHALQNVVKKNENGISEIDKLKKCTYDKVTLRPSKTTPRMKKRYENDEQRINEALENWLEIPLLNAFRSFEKETLAMIIFFMNEELRKD